MINFINKIQEKFSPWSVRSGTEHMGVLLHSLVRSTRARTVLEYGTGYSTFFLAKALSDNIEDFAAEKKLLIDKSTVLLEGDTLLSGPIESWPSDMQQKAKRWMDSGDLSTSVDPNFYLEDYRPRLYSFERGKEDDEYVRTLNGLLQETRLADVVTLATGIESPECVVPPTALPVDLAWNDHHAYRRFFEAVWPQLSAEGGLMIFHNPAESFFAGDIAWMREQRAAAGDLQIVMLREPHKFYQNGCAILQKRVDHVPYVAPTAERLLATARLLVDQVR